MFRSSCYSISFDLAGIIFTKYTISYFTCWVFFFNRKQCEYFSCFSCLFFDLSQPAQGKFLLIFCTCKHECFLKKLTGQQMARICRTCRKYSTFPTQLNLFYNQTGSCSNFVGDKSSSKKLFSENKHLKSIRQSNLNGLIFTYLCINSLRNKFEFLSKDTTSNIDLFMILGT